MKSKKMNSLATWDEMIKLIEELNDSLDTTHYLTLEDWKKLAKELNL
jgi:hypothetical protein